MTVQDMNGIGLKITYLTFVVHALDTPFLMCFKHTPTNVHCGTILTLVKLALLFHDTKFNL